MTIASAVKVSDQSFLAVSGTTPIPVTFPFATADDLLVVRVEADASETVLTRNSHYSISGDGRAIPSTGALVPINLTVGATHRIRRRTSLGQTYDPQTGVAGDASAQENQLDDIVMRVHEVARDADDLAGRALLVPRGETVGPLPALAARAGKVLGFTAGGAPTPIALDDSLDGSLRADLADPDAGARLVAFNEFIDAFDFIGAADICVSRFGAVGDLNILSAIGTDDTAAIQNTLDFVKLTGGRAYLERGKIYKTTAELTVGTATVADGSHLLNGKIVNFDLNGGRLVAYLDGETEAGVRVRSFSALHSGGVKVVSSGTPGISSPNHCPVVAGANYGSANTVAAPSPNHDPHFFAIYDLHCESDKFVDVGGGHFNGAPGVQIIAGNHYRVDGITVPDSAKMYGLVCVDWGYIGAISTLPTKAAQDANKAAFDLGTAYVVPSRNGVIDGCKAGALTAPSTATDIGAFGVRLSGVGHVRVARCHVTSVTYQTYVHEAGDLGDQFVRAVDRALFARGVEFKDCTWDILPVGAEGLYVRTLADNVATAAGLAPPYVPARAVQVEGDVWFDGGGGRGAGLTATKDGARAVNATGGGFRGVNISGFVNGVVIEQGCRGVWSDEALCSDNQRDGVLIGHGSVPPEDCVARNSICERNGTNVADGSGVVLGKSKRCRIEGGRLGQAGVANDPSQFIGWKVQDDAEDAEVILPHVLSFKAGGAERFLGRGDVAILTHKEVRGFPNHFYQSAVAVAAHTGTVAATVIGPTIGLVGKSMGANGVVEIDVLLSSTGAAGTKQLEILFGGTRFHTLTIAAGENAGRAQVRICNRNAENSQIAISQGGGFGANASGVATGAINTANAANITFRATLANAADSLIIEAIAVKIDRAA